MDNNESIIEEDEFKVRKFLFYDKIWEIDSLPYDYCSYYLLDFHSNLS